MRIFKHISSVSFLGGRRSSGNSTGHLLRCLLWTQVVAIVFGLAAVAQAQEATESAAFAPTKIRSFLKENCYDCHEGTSADAGFDLEQLADQLTDANAKQWTHLFDRVAANEMPPADYGEISARERKAFLKSTGDWIAKVQRQQIKSQGRVRGRRLNNLQLERTLHDVLGINIPLASRMPEEPKTGGFTTVATGQAMSHFQLEQHVNIVDLALDEAFDRALTNKEGFQKTLAAKQVARRKGRRRCREPEMLNGAAVTWSSTMPFYGRVPKTASPEDGWYRITISAKGLNPPKTGGVWCSVRSGLCHSTAPLMAWVGAFEASQEFTEVQFDAWLPKGHMIEIRPGDSTLKKAKFNGGQVGIGEGAPQNVAGVAVQSIAMQLFFPGAKQERIRKVLFGNQKLKAVKDIPARQRESMKLVTPPAPKQALESLVLRFANRSFRRPVSPTEARPYIAIAQQAFNDNGDFVDALRLGYRAILCSPRFLYFYEPAGKLDDFAIANRLSYFLWNRMPDFKLMKLAHDGKLSHPKEIKRQTARMLNHPNGKTFVVDFADQWLDMSEIDFTEPDKRNYPGFDQIVEKSMLEETHRFLQKMLEENLSVANLIHSDFTFLNSRLAQYYLFDDVRGDQVRQVAVPKESNRGGLLTHGSILKVTANGSTTSPVIRGVWVSERILGVEIPPPPTNVPAIEPDIRGAKTFRDMLAKHKENGDCASCHRKIDPPGFALENFDPSGRWRDTYQTRRNRNKNKRNKRDPQKIDPSFEMPDGQAFKDLSQFKEIVLKDKETLARNVVEKMITYGTGATIAFADRPIVDRCVARAAQNGYGFNRLLQEVVTSDLFLSK